MNCECDCVLLDIEGTTSSISYVHDEMFPFVRKNLAEFLRENWETESLQESINLIGRDAGYDDWPTTSHGPDHQQQEVASEVNRQMDQDLKATGLKNLQGKIWKSGFESGALEAHLFEDTLPAIQYWKSIGKQVRIYSSGSVQAQLLFFGHTIAGNLLDYFSGHYDTKIGGKKEISSYQAIACDIGIPAEKILFVSDILEELDAASAAGLRTALSLRPGNTPVEGNHDHPVITSFAEIQF